MAKIQTIKNKESVTVYPQTHTQAVYDANGKKLQEWMSEYLTAEDSIETENINNDYEKVSNKVVNINETSTDIEYPSAKAVYKAIIESNAGIKTIIPEDGNRPSMGESSAIYLIPSEEEDLENIYEEWMYINGTWERIGSTVLSLDDYVTKKELEDKNYLDKTETSLEWLSTEGGVESKDDILAAADTKYAPINTVEVFTNVLVPVSLWVEDATYQEFAFKANIPCEGVTANYFPNVVFNVSEALSGNYAQVCLSGDGIVTIYAVNLPETDITIPSIVCTKEA